MTELDLDRLVADANSDGEFQVAARLWNANLRLDVGDHVHVARIRDGKITELARVETREVANLGFDQRISAPESDWAEMLKPIPRPFFQDLMAAVTRQGFKIEGDLVGFYPYYRAVNRLIQLMRESRRS